MALQGTLETFSVPEVLRLLAGTRKSGLLALEGDRGAGNVWLIEGRVVSALSDHEQGDRIEAVLFDLLRFETGSFVFDADSRPDEEPAHDADVEEVLGEAERMLDEWREIESVVPSLDVRVHLVDELRGESVTVTADQWRSLALIGSGLTARRIGAHLELGEFDACNLVRGLVDAGLVDVTEDAVPDVAAAPEAAYALPIDDGLVDHDLSHEEVASLGQNLAGFVARPTDGHVTDGLDIDDPDTDDVLSGAHELTDDDAPGHDSPSDEIVDVSASTGTPFPDPEPEPESDPGPPVDDGIEPEDFLSQLSNLSPRAAAAIEATAERTGDEVTEPETPLDAVPAAVAADADGDEEINRNLLLKFLSSAKN